MKFSLTSFVVYYINRVYKTGKIQKIIKLSCTFCDGLGILITLAASSVKDITATLIYCSSWPRFIIITK